MSLTTVILYTSDNTELQLRHIPELSPSSEVVLEDMALLKYVCNFPAAAKTRPK